MGLGTEDSEQALSYLKRFGSVSVLNGHIHQVMQKVEGNVTFHTARSTAFPQPEPGKADSPGPMKNVPAEKLKSMLGLASVNYTERPGILAVVDSTAVLAKVEVEVPDTVQGTILAREHHAATQQLFVVVVGTQLHAILR